MTEADLAQALRKRMYYIAPSVHLVAVPNGAKRTPWEARQAKKEGMASGFPDMVALWPGGGIAFLELKTPAGRVSEAQQEWLARLDAYGFPVAVIRDVEAGVAFLRENGAPVRERRMSDRPSKFAQFVPDQSLRSALNAALIAIALRDPDPTERAEKFKILKRDGWL